MSTCIHAHCPTNGARNSNAPLKTTTPGADRTACQHRHQHCATGLHNVTIYNNCVFSACWSHNNNDAVESMICDKKIAPATHDKGFNLRVTP
jgi:hypothetical protein